MSEDPTHPTPHDALFKRVFADVKHGAALLRSVLPVALASQIDWSSVRLRSGTYVDAELRGLASDLVFEAEIAEHPVFFYLMVEHQSAPDASMAWRLWRYTTRLWDRHARIRGRRVELPLIVPVVVYHGVRAWSAPTSIDALVRLPAAARPAAGDLVPRFTYLVDDLTILDGGTLRARSLPALATLALWALRTASDRGFVDTLAGLADLVDDVWAAPDGPTALGSVFSYLSIVSGPGEDLAGKALEQVRSPIREHVMELEEMLAEKRRQEGREEGREEGRAQGRAEVLLMFLRRRFPAMSDDVERRVRTASTEETDRWLDRVLAAESLDDVFR